MQIQALKRLTRSRAHTIWKENDLQSSGAHVEFNNPNLATNRTSSQQTTSWEALRSLQSNNSTQYPKMDITFFPRWGSHRPTKQQTISRVEKPVFGHQRHIKTTTSSPLRAIQINSHMLRSPNALFTEIGHYLQQRTTTEAAAMAPWSSSNRTPNIRQYNENYISKQQHCISCKATTRIQSK
jgi:hypothetical protein